MARANLILLACLSLAACHTTGSDRSIAYPSAPPISAMPF